MTPIVEVGFQTIWKFPFPILDRFVLSMPKGARVLCAQAQNGEPVMWAEVDAIAASANRAFRVIGTGNPFPKDIALSYVGSVQLQPFVWHVYEEVPHAENR